MGSILLTGDAGGGCDHPLLGLPCSGWDSGSQFAGKEARKASCTIEQFQCENGDCVSQAYRCDGEENCVDGSDEVDCPTPAPIGLMGKALKAFKSTFHKSFDQKEKSKSKKADLELSKDGMVAFDGDCNPREHFECESGGCIDVTYRCDRDTDCSDGSDERNCTSFCSSSEFSCDNGNCINGNYICDSDNDCGDRSDEAHCDDD